MKLKLIVLVICCLVLACENSEGDLREDWVKDIENSISKYNKHAKLEFTKVFKEGNQAYKVEFYHKDEQGLQMIKTILDDEDFIDITTEQYLLNDVIVYDRTTGTFPLIYKRTKEVIDPCCEIWDRLIYFRNSMEGNVYMKTLRIMNFADKDKYIDDLNSLEYKQEERFNIVNEFDRLNTRLERIKENVK